MPAHVILSGCASARQRWTHEGRQRWAAWVIFVQNSCPELTPCLKPCGSIFWTGRRKVYGRDRTPLAKCSGREGGKTRDAGRSERTLGQPSREAIKVEGRGGRHVLQTCLGQPTVARLAQAERAHALRERTLDPLTLRIKLTAGFTLQAGPSGRERLVFGARA